MRREALKRLFDAFEVIEAIERFIENCTLDRYLDDELIRVCSRSFPICAASLVHGTESSMCTKPWIS
jgi:hypothetical protein